jgi:type IV secretory pathway component VirB8
MWLVVWFLLALLAVHAYMSMRYNYDWIGTTTKNAVVKAFSSPGQQTSVTELFEIPQAPYADRFGTYTRTPRMKNAGY